MILLLLSVMYETNLHLNRRRAKNRKGKRTLVSKGTVFQKVNCNYLRDPNQGGGYISQLHYCERAKLPGSLSQDTSYDCVCLLKALFLLQK